MAHRTDSPSRPRPLPAPAARIRGALGDPVVRNGYVLALTSVVTSLLGVLFWALAARLSSPEEVGRSSAAITALTLVANVAGLNLSGSLSYLLPQFGSASRGFLTRTYLVVAGIATLLGLLFLGGVHLLHAGSLGYLLSVPLITAVFVVAAPAFVLFTVQDGVLIGLRRSTWVLVENMSFSVAKLAALIVLLVLGVDHGIFYAWVGATILVVPVITGVIFGRLLPARDRTAEQVAPSSRSVRRFIGLQYLSALLTQVYMNTLPLIVLLVLGGTENGLFYVPWTIATTVDLVTHSMGASLTVEGALAPDHLGRHVRAICRRLGVLLGAGAVVGLVAAPLVLRIYGPEYAAEGTTLLRLLIGGALLRAVVVITQGATRAVGRTGLTLVTEGLTCALVLGISLAFLPGWGIEATGWAWLVGNAVVAAVAVPPLLRLMRDPAPAPGTAMTAVPVTAAGPVQSPPARDRGL